MTTTFGTEASRHVIRRLEAHGYEAVFVGGAVRDYVLGKKPTDIDIATSATPHEVKSVFSHTIDVGIDHGTVLVLVDNEPIEVTTYRTEGTYSDHRRPDDVQFVRSLKQDLERRDFTINALAMTLDGELIDLFGGQQDLKKRRIACVGDPLERFSEDALRMIRAVRFSSVLDFTIDGETFRAIQQLAGELRHIAIERIKIELDKLFVGKNPVKAFEYIDAADLKEVLPCFAEATAKLPQCAPFESALEGWASLMIAGSCTPLELARNYKLSNDEKKALTRIDEAYAIRQQRLFAPEDYYRFRIEELAAAEKNYQAFHPDTRRISKEEMMEMKRKLPIQSRSELAFTGNDLLKWAGIRGGKWTSEWISRIELAVINGLCENEATKIKEWFLHEFNSEK